MRPRSSPLQLNATTFSLFARASLLFAAMVGSEGCRPSLPGDDPAAPAAQETRPAKPARERSEFEREFRAWRTLVGELRRLDIECQTSGSNHRIELQGEYDGLVAKGTEMQERVLTTAVTAYARHPRDNADLGGFLATVVSVLFQSEEYEEALPIAQLLVDGGMQNPRLYDLAGSAAFVLGEFDLAKNHLRKAREQDVPGRLAAARLEDVPYYQQAWTAEKAVRAKELSAGDLPRVLLKTRQGEIELELFENEAPNTVANFISLIEKGFYAGLTFHRVVPRFAAEAGCPNGDGTGGPGYTIPREHDAGSYRRHFRGSLGMIPAGLDSSGSQFYLTFGPAKELDGNRTVFGRVVRGMQVLARLQRREPPDSFSLAINPFANDAVPPADKILETSVVRKRAHPYHAKVHPDSGTTPQH